MRVTKRRSTGQRHERSTGPQQNFDDSYKENYAAEETTVKRNTRNSSSAEKPPSYRNNANNSSGGGVSGGSQINRRDNRDRDDRSRDDRSKRQEYRDMENPNSDRDRDRITTGFRTGRNTIEFKNQNRNKGNLAENSSSNSPRGGDIIINSSKYQNSPGDNYSNHQKNHQMISSSPPPPQHHHHQNHQQQQQHHQPQPQQINSVYNQQQQQKPASVMESMSFTNTKMSRNLNNDKNLENYQRSMRMTDGQNLPQQPHHHQQQQQQHSHQQQPPPNNYHQEAPILHQPQPSYSSRNQPRLSQAQMSVGGQPIQQQYSGYSQQSDGADLTHQQQMTALANTVNHQSESGPSSSSSRPKRYSSQRQKPGVTENQITHQIVSGHHPSVNDPQIMQQLTELQYGQMAKNQQTVNPIHMQSEQLMATGGQQQQQQVVIHPQQATSPPQATAVAGQAFSQTFYATNAPGSEFASSAVHTQPAAPQIISGAPQYSGQYPQPVASTYIQPAPPPQAAQPPPPQTAYISQQQQPPPPSAHTQAPPPILNYVPQTQFTAPPQFPSYPNYSAVAHNPSTSAIYQTQSGLTFYAPQTQTQPRPILPQRRPTNAIPIMAPPERGGKGRGRLTNNNQYEEYEDQQAQQESQIKGVGGLPPPLGSAENIDHILDNMFVQRAPYQPIIRKSPPSQGDSGEIGGSTGAPKDDENSTKPEKMANLPSTDEIKSIENSVKVCKNLFCSLSRYILTIMFFFLRSS